VRIKSIADRRTLWLYLVVFTKLLSLPAASEEIKLERQHGTYTLPVQVNGTLILPFVLDTGAESTVLPADVFRTLTLTRTVRRSDLIGTGTAVLADGSKRTSHNYILREIRIGDRILRNIVVSVVSVDGEPLLDQIFLSKLPAWAIDNERQVLVIIEGSPRFPISSPAGPSASPALAHYGAIALNKDTGIYGGVWNSDSLAQAAEMALSACASMGCEIILRIGGAMCSALATTAEGRYTGAASGWGGDREAARSAALVNRQKRTGGGCIVRMANCNR
jgi:hypothetical protein